MSVSPADPADEPTDAGLWGRLSDKLEPPRLLSLTRAGKFFVLITLGVGFGALNTSNNLLFLLLGMMLSVIIASGVLSEAVLRNLVVRRRLPRKMTARQPAPATFRVTNDGWWPALSIEASEQNPRAVRGPATGRIVGPERIPWWKFWRRQTDDERRPVAATYCMRIDAGEQRRLSTRYELPTRGRYRLTGLQLKTRFPFALFEKTRKFSGAATVTVLPEAVEADEWIGRLESQWGDTARNQRGRGEEFYGLREYRPGEDQRLIHWKSTARRGEPVVKETEARQRRALLVLFDNRAPVDDPTPVHRRQFEAGIRRLTGLLHALRRRNFRLQLISPEGHVDPETAGDIEPLLRHLAVIELRSPSSPAPLETTRPDDTPAIRLKIGFDQMISATSRTDTVLSFDGLSTSDPSSS